MDNSEVINERLQKLEKVKVLLNNIDNKLLVLAKDINWDFEKLLEEKPSSMAICSINQQHRVPVSKLEVHELQCSWHHQGYNNDDKTFPEYSGSGSCITLTAEILNSITKDVPSFTVLLYVVFLFVLMKVKQIFSDSNSVRAVPQTSANFDQNFNREEKLAIYNYVIANTEKLQSYSDLLLQSTEKTVEKKEMAAWEIAAAERDAKRRRASYRNKVHTNRKTHTEILREVIEAQMEAFKEEFGSDKQGDKTERRKTDYQKCSPYSKGSSCKKRHHEFSNRRSKEDGDKIRNPERHSKHRKRKRSPSYSGSDNKSRSRSHDKYRKWKNFEGRSCSPRSSRYFM